MVNHKIWNCELYRFFAEIESLKYEERYSPIRWNIGCLFQDEQGDILKEPNDICYVRLIFQFIIWHLGKHISIDWRIRRFPGCQLLKNWPGCQESELNWVSRREVGRRTMVLDSLTTSLLAVGYRLKQVSRFSLLIYTPKCDMQGRRHPGVSSGGKQGQMANVNGKMSP